VQHRSHVARDPTRPNLRQVHLIQAELHDAAGVMAIVVAGGELRAGDPIRVELPPEPHRTLMPV
jgi:MOSC domain-containing protein YiiM